MKTNSNQIIYVAGIRKPLPSFGRNVRDLCLKLRKDVVNLEYIKQVVRSSGSVGANYIEAAENLGVNDERMKLKTARREVKESCHWLDYLLTYGNEELEQLRLQLHNEGCQINKILSKIILNVENRPKS